MNWELKEAAAYYRRQGAPGDQNALRNLLGEMQDAFGGAIPGPMLTAVAEELGVKESFLLALIRRFPSLRLADHHVLEICAGPNCSKKADLSRIADDRVEVRYMPCMRLCGKGPNIRFDGKLYHRADKALIRQLMDSV